MSGPDGGEWWADRTDQIHQMAYPENAGHWVALCGGVIEPVSQMTQADLEMSLDICPDCATNARLWEAT